MHRISAGLAACLAAVVAAGCGTAPASQPGFAAAATGTAAASAGTPSGCQGRVPAAGTVTITLAGNQKTYCLRVGDKLRVYLRGTDSSRWLRPLSSGVALVTVPDPTFMLARGVTGAAFSAVRPGRVLVTSVRPPCQVAITPGKEGPEPADPLPRIYPLRSCPPGHRFSAWVIVLR